MGPLCLWCSDLGLQADTCCHTWPFTRVLVYIALYPKESGHTMVAQDLYVHLCPFSLSPYEARLVETVTFLVVLLTPLAPKILSLFGYVSLPLFPSIA